MPPAAAIPAGAALVGSFLSSNQAKNAQRANLSQQTSLDNSMLDIYNNMMSKYNQVFKDVNPIGALNQAKNFYSSEVTGGLDPAVSGAAESQFQQSNALNLATLKNSLGPYTPNMAGTLRDFSNNQITGGVSLAQQLAAMNQQTRQQGAAGLTGLGQGVLDWGGTTGTNVAQGIGGLASQYGQAAQFNAANYTNPFTSIATVMAAYPNLFSPRTQPGQPGQGGLGATGAGGVTTGGGLGSEKDSTDSGFGGSYGYGA